MSTKVKTDELDQWHEYNVYTPARLIMLEGIVNHDTATEFIKNIRLMDHVTDNDITVLINSEGGEVDQGLAIYDAIKECNSKVITHAVAPCWSMASIILQAGDWRKVSRSASVMIHIGDEGYDTQHPKNLKRWMKESERIGNMADDELFNRIREKKPRFKREQFDELLTFDTIYSAKKALEMGLVDEIAEHKSF